MYMFLMNNLMWFWLAVMVVCVIFEVFTFTLTTVWGAVAALVMIFVSKTNMPLKWQIMLFLILTIALVLTTRPFAVKKLKLGSEKTNVDSMQDQEVLVTKKISQFEKGEVKVKNGVIWTAVTEDGSELEEGAVCRITSINGNTLTVRRI